MAISRLIFIQVFLFLNDEELITPGILREDKKKYEESAFHGGLFIPDERIKAHFQTAKPLLLLYVAR